MPRIVDYERVLVGMEGEGLKSLYYKSGAFGFIEGGESRGWIGAEDASIKPEAVKLTRQVALPVVENLVRLTERAWRELLPGDVWVMPKSHWAYELNFGNGGWLAGAIEAVGIDAKNLSDRNNAAAIEFGIEEAATFGVFLRELLTQLRGSDFQLAFPGRRTICTVHSHQQLWWTSTDEKVIAGLDGLL